MRILKKDFFKAALLPAALVFLLWAPSPLQGQQSLNFTFDTPYGHNSSAGKYAEINGTKIYYEEYGSGEPLLLIHGNGGSIVWMGNQIDFFKNKYRVIVADNRGQGRSELNTDSLTYEQITADYEALVKYLQLDSFSVVGWSDGGIVGLMMAINGRVKIKKLVAMGANLSPDTLAVEPWAVKLVLEEKKRIEDKILQNDTTQDWKTQLQLYGLMAYQPHIALSDLSKIKAEVLIMAGDKDIIRGEHSLKIYQHIPRAQLCIMPGQSHFAPAADPAVFNGIVDRFLSQPFLRPDSDWSKWEE